MFFDIREMKKKAGELLDKIEKSQDCRALQDSPYDINIDIAEEKLDKKLNGGTVSYPRSFIGFIAPDNWLSKKINYASVKAYQPETNVIGDFNLSTGRAEEGRFSRAMDINGTSAECYEMDTCEYIEWLDLIVMGNNVGNYEALRGVLCSNLTSKIYMDDLRVGFNGKYPAAFTDPKANPCGEDIAPGWQEVARKASEGKQILSTPFALGAGGDFSGVDELAQTIIKEKIPAAYQNDPRLVVMVGSELAAAERLRLFNTASGASDKEAASAWGSTIAGRFAFIPPFMPGKRLVITMLPNLLINVIDGSYRTDFDLDDKTKRLNMRAWRHQGYGLADVGLYAGVDESAVTLKS
ncbi:P2 family phage major capsid protein [Salmonella enterica]|nr:P2 family phage major capsid protein [Salmonella enterica]EJJ4037196.1 P2 family phage major capsid protein [Salmonella enterica]EJJ4051703.1 P2 family phage major capsid protein [Salmonella enterica]EJJ4327318.1 P2 family phage major capsid protein [Salmonella enterica]EJJ4331777.1 P2 family phage major capsid protein [Salmonella enterica]